MLFFIVLYYMPCKPGKCKANEVCNRKTKICTSKRKGTGKNKISKSNKNKKTLIKFDTTEMKYPSLKNNSFLHKKNKTYKATPVPSIYHFINKNGNKIFCPTTKLELEYATEEYYVKGNRSFFGLVKTWDLSKIKNKSNKK